MKVKTKYAALASITQVWTSVRGKKYPQFQADIGCYDGKRVRITRNTKSACSRAVEEWYNQRSAIGDSIMQLTPTQIADAVMAMDILKNAKCPDRLSVVAMKYVEMTRKDDVQMSLDTAYEHYYAKFSDHQEAQKEFVRKRVLKFVEGNRGIMLSDITAKLVKDWLDGHEGWSPTTWNQNMAYIRSFLEWCCKKSVGYMKENPISDMEKKSVKREKIEVASPEDVVKLLRAVTTCGHRNTNYMIARIAMSYFCGMRTSEIVRQELSDIHMDADTIVVTEAKGMQSGGRGRSFEIPHPAREWLESVDLDDAFNNQMRNKTYAQYIRNLMKDIGVTLPHNGGRHSFITYHIAKYGDPRRTEGIVGTSDSMRKNHYDAVGLKREGDAYFAITPASVVASTSAPST